MAQPTQAARLEEHESSSKAKVVELMKENEDLVQVRHYLPCLWSVSSKCFICLLPDVCHLHQQLTDAYTEFEVEKSAWAGRMKDHCDKLVSDANDRVIIDLAEMTLALEHGCMY